MIHIPLFVNPKVAACYTEGSQMPNKAFVLFSVIGNPLVRLADST